MIVSIDVIDVSIYQNIVSIIDRRLLRNALKPSEYVMLQKSFQKQHRMTLEEFFSGTKIILNGTREMQLVVHFHMIVQDATESIQPEQLLVVMTSLNTRLQIFGDVRWEIKPLPIALGTVGRENSFDPCWHPHRQAVGRWAYPLV